MRSRGDWRFNYWRSGMTFFSRRLNVGIYLTSWTKWKILELPGSTYCPGGTLNWELGPLRVTWVRRADWEVFK